VLRTHSPVRALTVADQDDVLAVCARDPRANVFVSARVLEGALVTAPGSVLGFEVGGDLEAVCWAAANLVPVGCDAEATQAFAAKVRKWRRQCASLFGPADMVLELWDHLSGSWGTPRAVRRHQPLMELDVTPSSAGVAADPAVRRARPDEVDLVMPAAAAMFTEEIGYPPYWGSGTAYRQGIAGLIGRGHTFVRVEGGQVVFKADVGSVGLGVAQIQGVWVAPAWRGQGLAEPAMAAVAEMVMADVAPVVTLYVNDFNAAARATYRGVGFTEVGAFATVLL
jgi:predicted GNAT family acetyltransferase